MKSALHTFFKDKKVLIIGHTTFLGSWLSMLLYKTGAKVAGLCLQEPDKPSLYNEADIEELIPTYTDKTNNIDVLSQIEQDFQADIIIRLSSICGCIDNLNPKEVYTFNLLNTLNVLEVSRHSRHVRVFMNVVPDYYDTLLLQKCQSPILDVSDLIMGSFRSTEFLTTGYKNAYFHPENYAEHQKSFVNFSFFNPIGGGDWESDNLLLKYFHDSQLAKKPIIVYPQRQHSLVHVIDISTRLLQEIMLLYPNESHKIENIKIGRLDDSIHNEAWIAEVFSELLSNIKIKNRSELITNEQPLINKFFAKSDYVIRKDMPPHWHAKEAVSKTIAWHQARERGADMQRYSLGQIDEFFSNQNIQ